MNNHLKQFLKGIFILFWMIVYWVLVGLIPKIFVEFYQEFYQKLFYCTISCSLLTYLLLVVYFFRKNEIRSFITIFLISLPYLLFLLTLVILASNLPRIVDVVFLITGIATIYLLELRRFNFKTEILIFLTLGVILVSTYPLAYDNLLYQFRKNELVENRDLGDFNFKITDRNGLDFYISDLKGKTICVDMWTSSCGNCIASMPDFESLNKKFATDLDYKIISLYCPVGNEQTYSWFKKYIDRKFSNYDINFYYIDQESFNKLNIRKFPEFLIISKNNKLVYRGQVSYLSYVSDNIYNKLKSINENY